MSTPRTPVSAFKNGFSPEKSRRFLFQWDPPVLLGGGDMGYRARQHDGRAEPWQLDRNDGHGHSRQPLECKNRAPDDHHAVPPLRTATGCIGCWFDRWLYANRHHELRDVRCAADGYAYADHEGRQDLQEHSLMEEKRDDTSLRVSLSGAGIPGLRIPLPGTTGRAAALAALEGQRPIRFPVKPVDENKWGTHDQRMPVQTIDDTRAAQIHKGGSRSSIRNPGECHEMAWPWTWATPSVC